MTGGNTNHYTTTDLGKWLNQVCLRSIHWEPQHNKCVVLSVSPMSGDLCFFIDHCRCLLFEFPTLAGIVLIRDNGKIRATTVRALFAPLALSRKSTFGAYLSPPSSCWYCLSFFVQAIFLRAGEFALLSNYMCLPWYVSRDQHKQAAGKSIYTITSEGKNNANNPSHIHRTSDSEPQ